MLGHRDTDGTRAADLFNRDGHLTEADRLVKNVLLEGDHALLVTFASAYLDWEDDRDCLVYLTNRAVIVVFPRLAWLYTERIWSDTRIGKPLVGEYSRQSVEIGELCLRLPKDEFKAFLRLARDVKKIAPPRRADVARELTSYSDPMLDMLIERFPKSRGLARASLAPSGRYDDIPLYRRMRDTRVFQLIGDQEPVYYIEDVTFSGKNRLGHGEGTLFLTDRRFLLDPLVPNGGRILEMPFDRGLPAVSEIPGLEILDSSCLRFPVGDVILRTEDARLLTEMAARLSVLQDGRTNDQDRGSLQ